MFNQNIKSPVNIPVSKIHPFEGNPYKVLDNEEMYSLIESIQQQGIISPVVVRPMDNTTDEMIPCCCMLSMRKFISSLSSTL